MAQISYRGNLSAAFFPFISKYQGQTVIVAGPDQNFSRQLQSTADTDKDIGIPQAVYMHNVMPTGNGLQSVGYEVQVAAFNGADIKIEAAYTIRDDALGLKAYLFTAPSLGAIFILSGNNPVWSVVGTYVPVEVPSFIAPPNVLPPAILPPDILPPNILGEPREYGVYEAPLPLNTPITLGHINGTTYIYFKNNFCVTYDFIRQKFIQVLLKGIDNSKVTGITECTGYMIAYTENAVAWSSTIDATDFNPSLQTGAGGGNVQVAKGNITCATPTSNGFLIYTQTNVVAAMYTANARYPFQFNECLGSGGVTSLERVTYESDTGYNYAYTSKGMQILQAKSAQTAFADLTDFLAGQYFEDFDEATLQFTYTSLGLPLKKKLSFIAARYMVISYGITELTHALVYDTVQKRFGKLKFTHIDCFEYEYLGEAVNDIPRKSVGFVDNTGKISTLDFSTSHDSRPGVLMLGKFQYARSRRLQIQEATFEAINTNSICNVYDVITQDGKTPGTPVQGIPLVTGSDVRTYGFGALDGYNHLLYIVGTFYLASYELKFNPTARI